MRSLPFHTRQVLGWYIPLPSYAPGFYMPEASAGAVKASTLARGPRAVKGDTFSGTIPGGCHMRLSPHPKTSPTVYSPSLGRSLRVLTQEEGGKLCAAWRGRSPAQATQWRCRRVLRSRIGLNFLRLRCLLLRLALRLPALESLVPLIRIAAAWGALHERACLESGITPRPCGFLSLLRNTRAYAREKENLLILEQEVAS